MILNMDNIRQERPIVGQILNIHKINLRQPLSEAFGTNVKKSMAFKTLKKSF